jgi:hypothetical protein
MAASFVLFIFSKVYSAWFFLVWQSYFRIRNYFRIRFFLFEIQTAKEGAQTSIHVAVASEISDVTGQFFCDCRVKSKFMFCLRLVIILQFYLPLNLFADHQNFKVGR